MFGELRFEKSTFLPTYITQLLQLQLFQDDLIFFILHFISSSSTGYISINIFCNLEFSTSVTSGKKWLLDVGFRWKDFFFSYKNQIKSETHCKSVQYDNYYFFLLRRFCESSTIHGTFFWSESATIWGKIIWVAIVVIGIAGSGWIIDNSFKVKTNLSKNSKDQHFAGSKISLFQGLGRRSCHHIRWTNSHWASSVSGHYRLPPREHKVTL